MKNYEIRLTTKVLISVIMFQIWPSLAGYEE